MDALDGNTSSGCEGIPPRVLSLSNIAVTATTIATDGVAREDACTIAAAIIKLCSNASGPTDCAGSPRSA